MHAMSFFQWLRDWIFGPHRPEPTRPDPLAQGDDADHLVPVVAVSLADLRRARPNDVRVSCER